MKNVKIFNVSIQNLTFQEAVQVTREFLEGNQQRIIYTPNTEIVMECRKDTELKELINSADLKIADGIGLVIGSKMRGYPLKERVTGFDLSMELLKIAKEEDYSLFFLGGKPGVAEKAAAKAKEQHGDIRIVGTQHGYFKGTHTGDRNHHEEQEVLKKINESKADILFVGLGFPKQELWIYENANKLNTKLLIGNGGVLDVLAGENKRAPDIFIKLNLEWFYRLIKNPSRWKRQLAIPKFLFYILKDSKAVILEE